MNRQRVTLLVLLHLSAAFNAVDHSILLDRLYTVKVHSWFTSYLHDRCQSISINGETSRRFEVQYGVPQGSCLGPLLFTLYASKLFTIIERHLPEAHAYADDIQLYVSFSANSRDDQSADVEVMQRCIVDIREWTLSDRLKLNDGKTEFVLIGSRQQLAKVNIDALHVGDCVTPLSSAVKNLGSWFDEQLKMDKHINSI
ncbi:Hypothetical predicted protein, partial [Paramuricea clavata]